MIIVEKERDRNKGATDSGTFIKFKGTRIGVVESDQNTLSSTRQVTRAPCLSLSRHTIMNFQTGKRYKTIRHC